MLADDAHWLDPPSCDVLTFLARRIDGEPIVLVTTARDGYHLPLLEAGLPELRLDGLDEEAAGQLLDAVAPGLTTAAGREILDVSHGNPLALHLIRPAGCSHHPDTRPWSGRPSSAGVRRAVIPKEPSLCP